MSGLLFMPAAVPPVTVDTPKGGDPRKAAGTPMDALSFQWAGENIRSGIGFGILVNLRPRRREPLIRREVVWPALDNLDPPYDREWPCVAVSPLERKLNGVKPTTLGPEPIKRVDT